ncbi:hypothetical protein B0A52_01038 [Exophiala mesophila]|uniref:Uncharacterized protein n=1 Tax=Exophiala mesophila TaxID=212818 RepID=A0A438NGA0_EXOME|nr:hypothetical protein B0A52_01038 [Exophiala mesophila]
MCRLLDWSFLLCDPHICGLLPKIEVKPCHRFSGETVYPWDKGINNMERPLCWEELEYREADVLCPECFNAWIVLFDKNDPEYINDSEFYHKNPLSIVHLHKESEVIEYWEPGLPPTRSFDSIDWNPRPKLVSPDDIPLSPTQSCAVAEATAELLNLEMLDHVEQVVEAGRQRRLKEAAERDDDSSCSPFSSDDESMPVQDQQDTEMTEEEEPPAPYIAPRRRITDTLFQHTFGSYGTRPKRIPTPRSKLPPCLQWMLGIRRTPATPPGNQTPAPASQASGTVSPPSGPPTPDDPFTSWTSPTPDLGWAPRVTNQQMARRWG